MKTYWPAKASIGLRTSSRRTAKKRRAKAITLPFVRNSVQAITAIVLLFVGWLFYGFVRHFETGGATPFVARPSLVEGFLPISGLVSLKHLIVNGEFDPVHPAALVIFVTVLAISLLFKKAFCSWFCPIGAGCEWTWKLGQEVLGRNFSLPRYVDYPLMSLKYLLLAFFIKSIVLDMDGAAIHDFIRSPYNKIVDVKMLYFFTQMSVGVAAFLTAIAIASAVVRNFWCRYLCPYGALLGLVGYLSPLAVTRNPNECTDCKLCTHACPNRVDVAVADSVGSVECMSCLACIDTCPRKGALELRILGRRPVAVWSYAAVLLATVATLLLLARFTGHWETSLTSSDWAQLIPQAPGISHFY